MWTLLAFFALSLAFSVVLTPLLRTLARRCGLTVRLDRRRKSQGESIPVTGGIGVLLASLAAVTVMLLAGLCPWDEEFFEWVGQWLGLTGGAIVISCVGLCNDWGYLRVRHKLFGQVLAVAIVISTGLIVKHIHILGLELDLGILAIPFTAFFLLAAINSLNLLDGMDGLLGTVALIATVAFAGMAAMKDQWPTACIAMTLAGALLGFLRYNVPPAKIYLGGSGSMLIGLVIGWLAIKSSLKAPATVALAAPVAILAIPILDTMAAIFRRKLTGRSMSASDRGHLHHCFLRLGFSKSMVLMLLFSFCLAAVAGAYLSITLYSEWLARAAAATVALTLIGMRWFGRGETFLADDHLNSLAGSLLKFRGSQDSAIRFQGSEVWVEPWAMLTRSGEEMALKTILLDVNALALHESYYGRWVNPRDQGGESEDASWNVAIPLMWQGQTVGRLEVSGTRDDLPVWKKIATLTRLVDKLEGTLKKIADEAGASRLPAEESPIPGVMRVIKEETAHAAELSPKKLHVLVFNRSYHPDVEATGQLLTELCSDLAASHAVHVVAGQPNFVSMNAGGLIQKDAHQGVAITRVRNRKFSKKSMCGRIVGLLSYLVLASWVGLRSRRPDVVLVETDPPVLGVLGVLLSRWHRCPFIYYLQDLHPEVGLALGKFRPGMMSRLLYWATQIGLRGADRIIVLGEDMRAKVVNRGIAVEKTTVVSNWADTNLIFPRPRTNPWEEAPKALESRVNGHAQNSELNPETDAEDSLVVMYSGNLGLSQNLEQLLEVAREMRDLPLRFVVVGDGAAKDQLQAQAQAWNLTNVRFYTYQAKEKLGESLAAADVHFIPLRRGLAGAIVPSKLYGILAAGVPFIAAVDLDSEVARVAKETGAGIVIPPDSAADLATTLRWCLKNRASLPAMGRRGRHLAETRFSRPVCVSQIEQVIADVTMTNRSASRNGGPLLLTIATEGTSS